MADDRYDLEAKARRWAQRNNLTVGKTRKPNAGVIHLHVDRQVDPRTTESMTLTFKRGKRGTVRVYDPLDGWITGTPRQTVAPARYKRPKR